MSYSDAVRIGGESERAARQWTGRALQEVAVLGILFLMAVVSPVHGATFTVSKLNDTLDGTCDSDCSLREAVVAANESTDLLDLIVVSAGTFTLTIPGVDEDDGATGDLDLKGFVLIMGQGPSATVIDADGDDQVGRVVHIQPLANVTMRGMTITGGVSSSADGGGIRNEGNLILANVVVSGNWALGGGGIYNYVGELTIEDGSQVNGNTAAVTEGGGIYSNGGNLTMTDSTIADNVAFQAAGLSLHATDTTITGSTISGNSADVSRFGGGLSVYNSLTLVEVVNSTISNNSGGTSGDALRIVAGNVSLHSVTISGNDLDGVTSDDVVVLSGAQLSFYNTIISSECGGAGTFVNNGGSVESPGDTCQLGLLGITVPDLMLSELGDFGGPTETLLPLAGSPVVGYGSSALCLDEDQRGMPRYALACDAGAVERNPILIDGFESGDTSMWSSAVGQ